MINIYAQAPLGAPPIADELHLRALAFSDLPQVIDLQADVYRCLPDRQKSFIVLKSPDAFTGLLHPPHGGTGIFNQKNRLVAQAFLKIGHAANLAGLTDTPAARLLAKTAEHFGVAQSVLVHPEYRGQHLMRIMLNDLEEKAHRLDLNALITEVALGNDRSTSAFLHNAYIEVGRAADYDGTQLMFLQKTLRKQTAQLEST